MLLADVTNLLYATFPAAGGPQEVTRNGYAAKNMFLISADVS